MIHPTKKRRLWDILILSVPSRKSELGRLISRLEPQLDDEVGMLVLTDNQDYEVGYKRTQIMGMSQAEYVSFIDDDDMVSEDYVATIKPHLDGANDYVGYKIEYLQNGKPNKENGKPVITNPEAGGWYESPEAWYRDIYHIGVIRRSIGVQFPFEGMIKEDSGWATKVRKSGLIRQYVFLDDTLYTYDKTDKSLTRGYRK